MSIVHISSCLSGLWVCDDNVARKWARHRQFGWKIWPAILDWTLVSYLERRRLRRDGDHGEREQRRGASREIAGNYGMHETSRRAIPGQDPADRVVLACLSNPLHAFDFGHLQIRWDSSFVLFSFLLSFSTTLFYPLFSKCNQSYID